MFPDIGYTNWYPPDSLPRFAIRRSAAPYTGLETGAQEGGVAPRRLASTHCFRGGGRLVLLKTVLEAIPIYYMSIFRMPVRVRKRLERSMRDFDAGHGGENPRA